MGVDCLGVERVIHWGPPNDVETYIQQTGRSGREGECSYCVLLIGKGQMRYCDQQMRLYCENKVECRRNVLFKDFRSYVSLGSVCKCCDICCSKCKCSDCSNGLKNLIMLCA